MSRFHIALILITLFFPVVAHGEVLEPGMTVGETHHLGNGYLWNADVDVANSASGHSIFTWTGYGPRVKARIFDAQGRPASDEILVDDGVESSKVEVAVAADGSFVIAWDSFVEAVPYVPGEPDGRLELRARAFAADGTPTSETFIVSEHIGFWTIDSRSNGRGIVAAWSQTVDSTLHIFAQHYAATGEPVGERVQNENIDGSVLSIDVASLLNGDITLLWLQASTEEEVWFSRVSASGNAPAQPVLVASGDIGYGRVIAGSDGNLLINWNQHTESGWETLLRRQTASGSELIDPNSITPASHSVSAYRIKARPGGGYIFIWSATVAGEEVRKQFFREFDVEMAPIGDAVEIEALDWWMSYTTHQVSAVGVSAAGAIAFAYQDDNQEYIGRTVAGAGVDLAVDATTTAQSVTQGKSIELNVSVVNNSRAGGAGNATIDDAIGRASGVSVALYNPNGGLSFTQTSSDGWQCAAASADLYACEHAVSLAAGETAALLNISVTAEEAGDRTLSVEVTAGNTGDIYIADNTKEIAISGGGGGGGVPGALLLSLLVLMSVTKKGGAASIWRRGS